MAFPWLNIDAACHKLMVAAPHRKARLDIRTSIPGLGEITALVLLIDMPELGSMDAKQAASSAGLAPVPRQSGQWRGKAFIQGGRATLRQAIYPGSRPDHVRGRLCRPSSQSASTHPTKPDTTPAAPPENPPNSP